MDDGLWGFHIICLPLQPCMIGSLSCLLSYPNALQEISIHNSATSLFSSYWDALNVLSFQFKHTLFSPYIYREFFWKAIQVEPRWFQLTSNKAKRQSLWFLHIHSKNTLGMGVWTGLANCSFSVEKLCLYPQTHPQEMPRTEGTGIVPHGSQQRADSQAKLSHRLWDTVTSGAGSGILNLFPIESWAACSFESSKSGEKNLQIKYGHPFLQYFDTDQCPTRRGHL